MSGMLERESELERLDAALARSWQGEGGVVVLEGPAGIGKSRLLETLRAQAAASGMATLTARGGELERDFSFGLMTQLFERELASADPARRATLLAGAAALSTPAIGILDAGESAPVDASFAICHGLYWLVANLALERPLLIVVDDVHWADAPSLRALRYLAGRLEGLQVLLALAARPGEPGADAALLAELLQQATVPLRPAPLSAEGVRALIEAATGEPAGAELVEAARAATAGNPFLLEALLRAMRAEGLDAAGASGEQLAQLRPHTVTRSLLLRLARLPDGATQLVRAVAVLAGRADLALVAGLAQLPEAEAGRLADALAAAEILRAERPLAFVHPIVRTAVYEDVATSDRSALHARAAALLRAAGVGASELAPHLLATEPCGDAETVALLRAAAERALAQGAPDLAQRCLRRALREPPAGDALAGVLAELGEAEWLGGEEPLSAVAHLSEALERTPDPALRPARALALHRALFAAGQVTESFQLLRGELERLAGQVDAETLLRLESELASIGLLHPSTVEHANARLQRFEQLTGETPAELLQLANVACWKWASGTAAETVAFGARALADARLQAADASDSIPIYEALWALVYADEHELALAVLDDTLADARTRGSVFGVTTSCALRAMIAQRRGDTALAEVEARTAAAMPGLSDFVRPPIFGSLTLALVARGELEQAEQAIGQSGCGPALPEFVCLNPAFHARGLLRLAQGRWEEALEDFTELGERSRRVRLRNPGDPWRLGAAEALVRLGRRPEAIALADEQLELARHWGTVSAIGVALHGRALARGADADELAIAADVLAPTTARLDRARALVDLGAALRRANRRVEAREPLRQGLELAQRCGATPLAGRAHEELLVAGARPRKLMFSGVEGLTAGERRVAEMAAGGRSNREIAQALFVTAKTVENQLGRAYAKLGISSRAALAQALGGGDADAVAVREPLVGQHAPDAA